MSDHPVMNRRPDEEDLAAFAEGRLDASLRDAVLERLASDEDYHELYVELLRFQEEEGEEESEPVDGEVVVEGESASDEDSEAAPEEGKVLTSPRWWRRGAWVGLVAAALLAVWIAPQILYQPPTLEALVVGLEPNASDLREAPGRVNRGPGEYPDGLTLDSDSSFLLGALLVDVELGTTLKLHEDRRPKRDIDRLLDENLVLGLVWKECRQKGLECSEAIVDSRFVDTHSLSFGMWSRAVWLAARAGNVAYVSSERLARGLKGLINHAPDDSTREELRDLRKQLDSGNLMRLTSAVETSATRRGADFYDQIGLIPALEDSPSQGPSSASKSE